jgi:hypothetical protein
MRALNRMSQVRLRSGCCGSDVHVARGRLDAGLLPSAAAGAALRRRRLPSGPASTRERRVVVIPRRGRWAGSGERGHAARCRAASEPWCGGSMEPLIRLFRGQSFAGEQDADGHADFARDACGCAIVAPGPSQVEAAHWAGGAAAVRRARPRDRVNIERCPDGVWSGVHAAPNYAGTRICL